MRSTTRIALKVVKEVTRQRNIDPFLPARCFSVYHQPKRPVKNDHRR